MVQITLQFASLEAARAALLEIPSSILAAAPVVEAKTESAAPAKKPAATQPAPELAPMEVAPPGPVAASPSNVDYPTLQKAVFALAGKSREAAGAVAAELGVKTFKDLTEDKWADALVAVNAALAEAA